MDTEPKVEHNEKKSELEEQIALLNKKVDEQFKFTRTVVVLCTLVTIGLIIVTILLTFESLPAQITLYCMSNMEPIVKQWKQVDAGFQKAKMTNPESPAQPSKSP